MSTGVSFWKRVGDVFRAGGVGGRDSNGNGRVPGVEAADASRDGDPDESGPPPSEAPRLESPAVESLERRSCRGYAGSRARRTCRRPTNDSST